MHDLSWQWMLMPVTLIDAVRMFCTVTRNWNLIVTALLLAGGICIFDLKFPKLRYVDDKLILFGEFVSLFDDFLSYW